MQPKSVDAGRALEWITEGWRIFMRDPGVWIVLTLIFVVLSIVLNFIPFIGSVALYLITPALFGGFLYAAREALRGGSLEVAHLGIALTDADKRGPMLLLGAISLVFGLAMFVVLAVFVGGSLMALVAGGGGSPGGAAVAGAGLAVAIGLLLALIIGLLWTMCMLYAVPLVMFDGVEPVAALKSSFAACLRNMLPMLLFGVIYLIAAVLASLPFFLGWLVLLPVTFGAIYASYRDIYGGGEVTN